MNIIDMEKVAGRYEPRHDVMQDIPKTRNETVDVQDRLPDAKPSYAESPEKVKQTLNTNVENFYEAQRTEMQIESLGVQTKALTQQTDVLQEQGKTLDQLNVTVRKLYDLLYREHTKITPKVQETRAKPIDKEEREDNKIDFSKLPSEFLYLFDALDGDGPDRRKKGNRKNRGWGERIKNGAGKVGGFISGLGSGFRGLMSGGGWRGALLKGALGAGAAAVGYKGLESLGGLGAVSEHFESGGRGVNTISSGNGDNGGVSYGKHQLSSRSGTMAKFLRSEHGAKYAPMFEGLTPGSAAFNEAYKNVAAQDSKGFSDAQQAFMKATHYDPLANKVQGETGIDVGKRSRAFQELVFSTATQYGPQTSVIKNALNGVDTANASDEDLIKRIQDYKANSVGSYFGSSSFGTQQSVANRTQDEKAMLLRILEDEKKNPQQIAGDQKATVTGAQAEQAIASREPIVQTPEGVTAVPIEEHSSASAIGLAATTAVGGAATTQTGRQLLKKGASRALPGLGVAMTGYDAYQTIKDDTLSREEKERELAGMGGGMAGAAAGGAAGAALGSVVPIFGTAVGGVVGSVVGYMAGDAATKGAMDSVMGTPEERQQKAANEAQPKEEPVVLGEKENPTKPSAPPVTQPSPKEMLQKPAAPQNREEIIAQGKARNAELKAKIDAMQGNLDNPEKLTAKDVKEMNAWLESETSSLFPNSSMKMPTQKSSVLESKPTSNSFAPESPASATFYKSEPVIAQKPQTTATVAPAAPAVNRVATLPEPAKRQQFDTVQSVRMAVDQPAMQSGPAPAPADSSKGAGGNGSSRTSLDEVPAMINDFGLLFVNSGFI
jgi:hypothetical protein